MLKRIYYDYFLCNLEDYVGVNFPITAVFFSLTVGLILACFFVYYKNRVIYLALKRLFKNKCLDAESAKTLTELKLSGHRSVRYALDSHSMLTHYVRRVGEEEFTYERYLENKKAPLPRVDFESARFYLDKEYLVRARAIVDRGEEPISKPILSSVLFLVVFLILLFTMPSILSLLF